MQFWKELCAKCQFPPERMALRSCGILHRPDISPVLPMEQPMRKLIYSITVILRRTLDLLLFDGRPRR
ncbi:hypothetical protein ASD36_18770 [Rhizobium sp. Root1334]|nr:hypothetical protein ASD36_18770 [Rhizobium sp. Root1334]